MTISIEEWEQRKAFVGFGETEAQLLSELKELVVDHTDEIIDKLYANWSDFKELRELLKGQDTIQRLKST
ncbi:Protoglobin [Mariprofundus aestuarium]|uniref:Protoglobin n=1 Tax=Mariprofundus aestuarium TaxID=1921086 RepID=A0A2K8KVD0_MARES|nr:Protoglobin [Mariprofundus aestuarium]